MLNQDYLNKYDFLLITLDSLCYSTTEKATIPNIEKYGKFRKVYTQATYTFPSHCSMFQGLFPDNRLSDELYYNRKLFVMFSIAGTITDKSRNMGIIFPNSASNIIRGFEECDYRTIGIGGVGWFDSRRPTSSIWKTEFFNEFYYEPAFHETSTNSIKAQIEYLRNKVENENRSLFAFINISATHSPYLYKNQVYALEQFDKKFPELLNIFKERGRPLFLIIVADHGDVINNWQKYNQRHSFYIDNDDGKSIMEVPMLVLDLKEGVK